MNLSIESVLEVWKSYSVMGKLFQFIQVCFTFYNTKEKYISNL